LKIGKVGERKAVMCESNPLLRFAEFGNRFVFNDGKCDLKSNIQKSYIYIYIIIIILFQLYSVKRVLNIKYLTEQIVF
jgi:hypothetical protein